LKKQKWQILREPQLQKKIEKLANVNEQLRIKEKQLKTLLQKENEWWSMGFATRFAERCQWLEPKKGKGDMNNEALYKLFKQAAETKRTLEAEPLEKMAKVFRGSTA
jgi:hypothetical protein